MMISSTVEISRISGASFESLPEKLQPSNAVIYPGSKQPGGFNFPSRKFHAPSHYVERPFKSAAGDLFAPGQGCCSCLPRHSGPEVAAIGTRFCCARSNRAVFSFRLWPARSCSPLVGFDTRANNCAYEPRVQNIAVLADHPGLTYFQRGSFAGYRFNKRQASLLCGIGGGMSPAARRKSHLK